MKQFFYVLFGGLVVLGIGLGVFHLGSDVWQTIRPGIAKVGSVNLGANISGVFAKLKDQTDKTLVSGLKRTLRYSAIEEEDVIDIISGSKPSSIGSVNNTVITAKAYAVRNLTSSEPPVIRNADRLLPIASLTKLVTAVVARKYIPPSTRITITKEIMSTYGNTAQFKVGETFLASDLMYPMLMVSSNDAAEAYARSYGRTRFIATMNEFAQSIGAYRTYFADASGLSPLNVSTANDLVTIIDWIRRNDPEILSITQLKAKTVRAHTWINPTHFLSWSNYVGGKNGYTPEANRTAASLFTMGGNKDVYAVILLGSEARDEDELKLLKKVDGQTRLTSF